MTTKFNTSRALSTSSHLDIDRSCSGSSWLGNFFRPFESPLDFEDDANQVSDHYHWRYLGISCLKSDTYDSIDVSFFQVFELKNKQTHSSLLPSECSNKPPANSSTAKTTTTTMKSGETSTNQLNRDHSTEHSIHLHGNYTIVISLNTQIFKPTKHQYYYIFPCDSIVETVNESPPYELFCSFYTLSFIHGLKDHLDKKNANVMPSNDHYSSPLSSSPHVTPDIKMEQGISHRPASKDDLSIAHVSLSGISKELHSIIKDTVAVFEIAYRNMMHLMKLHTEGVSNRHSELLIVGGTNGTLAKKSPNEGKSGTNKRKGSSQQLPAFASDRVYTTTMTGKAKSTPSDTFESSAMPPTSVSASPPSSSPIATTSSSESAPPVMVSVPSTSKNNNSQRHSAANGRKCIYCGATKTPMWRRGPQGAGTLCNACGVKWKNGKILCGKSSELGSTSAAAAGSAKASSVTNVSTPKVQQKKKRKQQGESKIQQDKRVKIRKQLQYQQSRHDFSDSLGGTPREFFSHNMVDMHTDDDINIIADDDSDDDEDVMEADEHITHLRHPSTDKGQLQHSMSPYQLSPRASHSRSRSMTTSMAPGYRQYQQQLPQQQPNDSSVLHVPQEQSPVHPLLVQQYQHHQHHEQQQEQHHHHHHQQQQKQQQQEQQHQQHQQRPRRHTADVTVLDRAPWGEYPLSMGVDAVEAATVLTLLKRS